MKRLVSALWFVSVLLAITPASAQVHENSAKGFSADKTYEVGQLDSVNLFNGGLNVTVPLGQTYVVSPQLSYQFMLVYSGPEWNQESRDASFYDSEMHLVPRTVFFNTPSFKRGVEKDSASALQDNAGFGWRLSLGSMSGSEYTSADGAKHTFWPRLHQIDKSGTPPDVDEDITYTNDATYLRRRKTTDGYEIDFPNGNVHAFDAEGNLRSMRDAFGNRVNVSYADVNGVVTWTVEDLYRKHSLEFKRITVANPVYAHDPVQFLILHKAKLAAFRDADDSDPLTRDVAEYSFEYIGGDTAAAISRKRVDVSEQDCTIARTTLVPLLQRVQLPCPAGAPSACTAHDSYAFNYDRGDYQLGSQATFSIMTEKPAVEECPSHVGFTGWLTSLTLPSLGSLEWAYTIWHFPPESDPAPSPCPSATGVPGPCGYPGVVAAIGVGTRLEKDSDGTVLSKRTYSNDRFNDGVTDYHTNITTVHEYDVSSGPEKLLSRTLHYYSTASKRNPSTGGRVPGEYGLPFTRAADPDPGTKKPNPGPAGEAVGRRGFLSSKTYDALGQILRYSYVRYDGDKVGTEEMKEGQFANRRARMECTVDVVKSKASGVADTEEWTTSYSPDTVPRGAGQPDIPNFDGLGHYRLSERYGSGDSHTVLRTTTMYNPPPGGATESPLPEGLWILDRYTRTDAEDVQYEAVTDSQSTLACFDDRGFLLGKRVLRGAVEASTDLLTRYTESTKPNLSGFVEKEAYYGGDRTPFTATGCGAPSGSAAFEVTYGYAGAALRETSYTGLSFKSLNLGIDVRTGMVSSATDPAGRTTTYRYDKFGRVRDVKPPAQAWTSYVYDVQGKKAIARQYALNTTSNPLTEVFHYYDGVGRLIQQKTRMQGQWSTVGFTYDSLGRRKTSSVPQFTASSAFSPSLSAKKTVFDYDALGRTTLVMEPDQSTVSSAWRGSSEITTTVNVATVAHPEGEAIPTVQTFDPFGRLRTVTERSGAGGAETVTSYQYDGAGRMTLASTGVQPRTFKYDGAFLMEEAHPEVPLTKYEYDARGQVWNKRIGDTVWLQYGYDVAGRPTTITDKKTDAVLKSVHWDDVEAGQLSWQTRNNPFSNSSYAVKDSFTYEPLTGRPSTRQTSLQGGVLPQPLQFERSYAYTPLGAPAQVRYPTCAQCGAVANNRRDLTLKYADGLLTGIDGVTTPLEAQPDEPLPPDTDISYTPSGAVHRVQHAKAGGGRGVVDTFEPDADGMGRVASISFDRALDCNLITAQPVDAFAPVGGPVTLAVSVVAGANVQWFEELPGQAATPFGSGASLTFTAQRDASYWCKVTMASGGCESVSRHATVRICVPLAISSPLNTTYTVAPNAILPLSLLATGTNLTYSWQSVRLTGIGVGEVLPLGSGSAVNFASATEGTWRIDVTLTDACGQVLPATIAIVQVATAPTVDCVASFQIPLEPWAIVSVPGQGRRLRIGLNPIENPNLLVTYSFRWWLDGKIDHVETNTLSPNSFFDVYVHGEDRTVRVEAWVGCRGPNESLTSQKLSPEVSGGTTYATVHGRCTPPTVTVSPLSQRFTGAPSTEQTLTFTADVSRPDVHYQWYAGNSGNVSAPIAGATSRTLTVPWMAKAYWVRVSTFNGDCDDYADSNTVTVSSDTCSPVVFTHQPSDATIAAGGSVQLAVSTTSESTATTWRWYRDTTELLGQHGPTYTARPIHTADYTAVAGNGCAESTTRVARIHVMSCADINVSSQPADLSIAKGSPGSLQVVASADASLRYQWYEGESGDTRLLLEGQAAPTLVLSVPRSTHYWVRISFADPNRCAIDSRTAAVTVCAMPVEAAAAHQPSSTLPGMQQILTVAVTGERLSYEWFVGKVPNDERMSSITNTAIVHPDLTTDYLVRVTSDCAPPLSDAALLIPIRVSVCPAITNDARALQSIVMPNATTKLMIDSPRADVVEWYGRPVAGGPEILIERRVRPANAEEFVDASITSPPITQAMWFHARVFSGTCSKDSESVQVNVCAGQSVHWDNNIQRSVKQGSFQTIAAYPGTLPVETIYYEGTVPGDVAHSVEVRRGENGFGVMSNVTRTFWARVVDPAGCFADTPALTIEVCLPEITAQPQSVLLDRTTSTSVTLAVTATPDNKPLTYQWYIGQPGNVTQPVAGATSRTYAASPTVDTTYWVRVTGMCGSTSYFADSAAATVTVCNAAQITVEPAGVIQNPGSVRVLKVAAIGTDLTYLWYRGVSGNTSSPTTATTDEYSPNPSSTTDYWVKVSGRCGTSVNSATAKVSIAATITTQPAGGPITLGAARVLTVAASGTQLAYQWYALNGSVSTAIAGATSTSYTTPAITADSSFYCEVKSGVAVTNSAVATLTVCQPRAISVGSHPNTSGFEVTMSVVSPGADETFEWYSGASGNTSAPLGGGLTKKISPLVTTSCWLRTKRAGCDADSAAVTIYICRANITAQPQSATIAQNTTRTLTVAATGTAPLSYQWYAGAPGDTTQPLSNGTSQSYTTVPLSATTSFWVRVSTPVSSGCSVNSVNSAAALITVCRPPAITAQPAPRNVTATQDAIFQVSATGDGLVYQWYEGVAGVTVTPVGTNSASLTIRPGLTKSYWVRVSGTCGSADSNAVLASVYPTITAQPAGTAICALGQPATFSVSASGSSLTYQWYRRVGTAAWETLAGQTAASMTIAVSQVPVVYHVTVASGNASSDSVDAGVTLNSGPIASITRTLLVTGAYRLTANVPEPDLSRGVTYAWYRGAIGNTTTPIGSSVSVTVTPAPPVTYWVRITFADTGCTTDKATSF